MLIGPAALIAALAVTGLAAVVPAARLARRLQMLGVIALTASTTMLALAFVTEDWRYAYVVANARSGVGPLLRLSGLWAGPGGSLLLWTTMVGWAAAVAARVGSRADHHRAVRIGATLTAGYGTVVAVTSWPFTRVAATAVDGIGLQPILEYPAMVWHPPLLYAGLTAMLVPSIVALSAITGRRVMTVTPSLLLGPLALLSAGLVTGALWAGVELGWGGYWAWDPIESAGLVAWACAAAALHASSRRPSARGQGPAAAALFLAPGFAALWATTLTRIGVVASVHAFADQPGLRLGLLTVAGVASVASVGAVIAAGQRPPAGGSADGGTDDRGGTVGAGRQMATAVLAAAAVLIALGTYEPLVEAGLSGDALSIAGHYYTRLLWPLCVFGGAVAVRADRAWWPAAAGSVLGLAAVPIAAGPFALVLGAVGGAVAASALAAGFAGRHAGALAHVGVGVVLIGIAGTVATTVTVVSLPRDRPTEVAGMTLTHRGIELEGTTATSGTPTGATATVEIDGHQYRPQLVTYPLRGASTAEVARRFDGVDEVQVVLLDGDADSARYQINQLPRIGLVWAGVALLTAGLVVRALTHRRPTSRTGRQRLLVPRPRVARGGPASAVTDR